MLIENSKKKSFIPPLVDTENSKVVTSSADKAELLNNFFTQCHQQDDSTIDKKFLPEFDLHEHMPVLSITEEDVLMVIKKLKCSVSRTPEKIPAIFIKRIGMNLLKPLTILYNQSLAEGKIPSEWEESIVVPIHKKGLRSSSSNYRPVSQTSVFCRLLEAILHHYMYNHLQTNNMISTAQHGFMKQRSTMTNQLVMLNILNENFDQKIQTEMILLDFSKAFDLVPHIKLVEVLNAHYINKDVIRWINNLLQSRSQRTVVNNELSQKTKVRSGVPQGSVIGPLTFNMYTNSLLRELQSLQDILVIAFADDIKIISKNPTQLQKALDIVENWCDRFKLKLNPLKSEHMCFRPGIDHTFQICGQRIKTVERTKDLGVVLNNALKWQSHVTQITSKATNLSYMILRSFSSSFARIKAYKTYVRPLLEQNSVVWNVGNRGEIRCLEKVQRMFTRRVLQNMNKTYKNYSDRLEILEIERLDLRRLYFDIKTVYKIINNLVDISTEQFFLPIDTIYNFRYHTLAIKKQSIAKTNIMQNSFKYRVIEAWNSLPNSVVTLAELNQFKAKLRKIPMQRFLSDIV